MWLSTAPPEKYVEPSFDGLGLGLRMTDEPPGYVGHWHRNGCDVPAPFIR